MSVARFSLGRRSGQDPEVLNEDEVIDVGELVDVQDKVFEDSLGMYFPLLWNVGGRFCPIIGVGRKGIVFCLALAQG